MKARLIAGAVAGALLIILALQNTGPVRVSIFFWHPDVPLVLVVLTSLIVGFAAGFLARKMARIIFAKHDEY